MTEDELRSILTRRETRNIEYKSAGTFADDFRVEIGVTIGAMANTPDGGTILVGIRERDGTRVIEGVTPDQRKSFDPTRVSAYLRNHFDPAPPIEVSDVVGPDGQMIVVIAVPQFRDVPIVSKAVLQKNSEKNPTAREGDVLIRTLDCQSRRIQSADEMRELLGRALTARSERLLEDIRAVVTGLPPRPARPEPEARLVAELPTWPTLKQELETSFPSLAKWEFLILPEPLSDPMSPQQTLNTIRGCKVSLRGWDFPDSSENRIRHHDGYLSSAIDADIMHERFALSRRGAFAFSRVLWTEAIEKSPAFNHPAPPERSIDFLAVLYDSTEFLRFALNLAESLGWETVWLRCRLFRILGRSISTFAPGRGFFGQRFVAANDEVTREGVFGVSRLKAGWKELAIDWTRDILTVFQWLSPDLGMLRQDQERLLERRL